MAALSVEGKKKDDDDDKMAALSVLEATTKADDDKVALTTTGEDDEEVSEKIPLWEQLHAATMAGMGKTFPNRTTAVILGYNGRRCMSNTCLTELHKANCDIAIVSTAEQSELEKTAAELNASLGEETEQRVKGFNFDVTCIVGMRDLLESIASAFEERVVKVIVCDSLTYWAHMSVLDINALVFDGTKIPEAKLHWTEVSSSGNACATSLSWPIPLRSRCFLDSAMRTAVFMI